MVHAEPFHRSMSVVLFKLAKSSAYPTVQTRLDETASVSYRVKKSAPDQVGFGVGTPAQAVPSQCRASVSRPVTVGGRPELYRPTAQMSEGPITAAPASSFSWVPRFGLGTTPQAALSSSAEPGRADMVTTATTPTAIAARFIASPSRLGRPVHRIGKRVPSGA